MLSSDTQYAESLADNTVDGEKQFIDPLEPNVSQTPEELDESQWHVDMLDRLHFNMSGLSQVTKRRTLLARRQSTKSEIVSLFGTTFLYSREACGWAECCRKVAQVCNCICNINTLVHNTEVCKAGPVCEIAECREKQISYTVCPLPCIMTKFIKHNEIRVSGAEFNMSIGLSKLKLIRSEAVQVATEEEIFSLAKLFSEVASSDCLPDRTSGSIQTVPNSASRSNKILAGHKPTLCSSEALLALIRENRVRFRLILGEPSDDRQNISAN
ncbi:hypothetical protein AHF37_11865 [Paragonimus kellicotti]|nr:hypothetical protein AHF37_11865 [Paragonimus kellicotti]